MLVCPWRTRLPVNKMDRSSTYRLDHRQDILSNGNSTCMLGSCKKLSTIAMWTDEILLASSNMWHVNRPGLRSACGETLGQGAKGRKGETGDTRYSPACFIPPRILNPRRNKVRARLDEAHLLTFSGKVLQKVQC